MKENKACYTNNDEHNTVKSILVIEFLIIGNTITTIIITKEMILIGKTYMINRINYFNKTSSNSITNRTDKIVVLLTMETIIERILILVIIMLRKIQYNILIKILWVC